jgi:hypothetical protein
VGGQPRHLKSHSGMVGSLVAEEPKCRSLMGGHRYPSWNQVKSSQVIDLTWFGDNRESWVWVPRELIPSGGLRKT